MTTEQKKLDSDTEGLPHQLNQSLAVPLSDTNVQSSFGSKSTGSSIASGPKSAPTTSQSTPKPSEPHSMLFFPSAIMVQNSAPQTISNLHSGNRPSYIPLGTSGHQTEVGPQSDPRTPQSAFDISQVAFFPKVRNVPANNTNTYLQSTGEEGRGMTVLQTHSHLNSSQQSHLRPQTSSPYFPVSGGSQSLVVPRGRGTFPLLTTPSSYYYSTPDATTVHTSLKRGGEANSSNFQHDDISFRVSSTQGTARRQPHAHYFMSEVLRQELQRRIELLMRGTNPDDFIVKALPRSIHGYHTLFPLEELSKDNISKVFGIRTLVLKAIGTDNQAYILRKVDTYRLINDYAMSTIEMWKQIQHPNVVDLKEVFLSSAFDNIQSLYFAYEYFPGAETLEERFLRDPTKEKPLIPEDTLWSIIIQVISGLKVIHSMGLAYRILNPSKILICGIRNRVRINCIGMDDVLNFDARRNIAQAQYEDLTSLGKLILILARRSYSAIQNIAKSLEFIGVNYSSDLKNLAITLLGKPNQVTFPTIDDVITLIGNRLLLFSNQLESHADTLETELMKELDNGRLLRLLVKLGFINERPEYDMSTNWSDTGDRYLLKLFRDYVFHQVYEDGNPYIDFAHVIDCLNKVDIGSDEKVLLSSRDEKYMLVISYKDIKRLIGEAFNELVEKNKQSRLAEANKQMTSMPVSTSYSSFVSHHQQPPPPPLPKTNT
jgi:PAB-dependent poly(A)-specific ribonuclease subunit 3